jgi:hypothetical protein
MANIRNGLKCRRLRTILIRARRIEPNDTNRRILNKFKIGPIEARARLMSIIEYLRNINEEQKNKRISE